MVDAARVFGTLVGRSTSIYFRLRSKSLPRGYFMTCCVLLHLFRACF